MPAEFKSNSALQQLAQELNRTHELMTDPGEDFPVYEELSHVMEPAQPMSEALRELMDIMDGGENLARHVRRLMTAIENRPYA